MAKAFPKIGSCIYNWINCRLGFLITVLYQPIYRWTNIPEQNFKPQLDQVLNSSQSSSISSLPLSREPFFIKYPWILEDIMVFKSETTILYRLLIVFDRPSVNLFQPIGRKNTTDCYFIVKLEARRNKLNSQPIWNTIPLSRLLIKSQSRKRRNQNLSGKSVVVLVVMKTMTKLVTTWLL